MQNAKCKSRVILQLNYYKKNPHTNCMGVFNDDIIINPLHKQYKIPLVYSLFSIKKYKKIDNLLKLSLFSSIF